MAMELDATGLPPASGAHADDQQVTLVAETTPGTPANGTPQTTTIELDATGNTVHLPEGTDTSHPVQVGNDLEFIQPDGSIILIPNGAVAGLTIFVGTLEIPADAVAALFSANNITPAEGPGGAPEGAHGGFTHDPGPIGTSFGLTGLLTPNELSFETNPLPELESTNTPPKFTLSPILLDHVSDEGLGSNNADGSPAGVDTTNLTVRTGSLGVVDPDVGQPLTFTLTGPSTNYTSNGHLITWASQTVAGTVVLTGTDSVTTDVVLKLTVTNGPLNAGGGQYTIEQFQTLDHPTHGTEDNLGIDVGITVTDGVSPPASATVTITVEDDSPEIAAFVPGPNLITNGEFVDGFTSNGNIWGTGSGVGSSVPGWTIVQTDGSGPNVLERLGADYPDGLTPTTSFLVDLEATPGNIIISQTVAATTGQPYTLTFEAGSPSYAPTGSTILEVYFDGQLVDRIVPTNTMQTYTYTVVGGGSNTLSFKEVGSPEEGYGTYLANVSMHSSNAFTVDEDALGGNAGGPGDVAGAAASVTGSLNISWGSDSGNAVHNGGVTGNGDRALTFDPTLNNLATSLHAGGIPVVYHLDATGTQLTAVAGSTTVFTVTLDDTTGQFTFNLLHALDHATPPAGTSYEDDLNLTFGFTATDGDGDPVSSTFTVTVDDDSPTLQGEGGQNVGVAEDDIADGYSLGTDPNVSLSNFVIPPGFAVTATGFPATATGSLSSSVSFGADGPAAGGGFGFASTATTTLAALGLTSKGGHLLFQVNGDTVYAYVNGGGGAGLDSYQDRPVFSLELNATTGAFTFRQYDQLDHVDGNGENTALRTGPSTSIPNIDFGAVITATDRDGDSIPLTGKLTVTITDDVPVTNGDVVAGKTLDDEAQTVFVPVNNGGTDDVSPDVKSVLGFPGTLFAVGTDDRAAIEVTGPTLNVVYKDANGFAQTEAVTWTSVTNPTTGTVTLTGSSAHYGSAAVLTVGVDGSYGFTMNAPVAHDVPGTSEEDATLKFNFKVTDFDQDSATGSLSIKVDDDTPTGKSTVVYAPDLLDDEAFTGANPGGDNDAAFDLKETHGGTGSLFSAGADGVKSVELVNPLPGFRAVIVDYQGVGTIQNLSVDSGVQGPGGVTTFTWKTADGITAATLKIGADGSYTFDTLVPLAHPNATPNSNGQVIEENLDLAFNYKVTDGDGDVANGTLSVSINDDTPTGGVVTLNSSVLIHDETPGQNSATDVPSSASLANLFTGVNGGSDPDVAHVDGGAIGYAQTNLVGSVSVSYGADGKGTDPSFSLTVSGAVIGVGVDSGLTTTEGQKIYLWKDASGRVVGLVDDDGVAGVTGTEKAAFALSVDTGSGSITVAQYLSIHHDDPADPDEPTAGAHTLEAIKAGVLSITAKFTDGDGDSTTASADIGSKVVFEDDGPSLVVTGDGGFSNGLFFDGFVSNSPTWGQGSGIDNTGAAGNWTIEASPIQGASTVQLERVGDGYRGADSPSDSVMVDMEASPGNVQLTQTLHGLISGEHYEVTFEIGAAVVDSSVLPGSAKLDVLWNDNVVGTYDPTSGVMQVKSLDLVAIAGDNTLTFREVGAASDNTGTFLANVRVTDVIIIDETPGYQSDSDEVPDLSTTFASVGTPGHDPDMPVQYAQGSHAILTATPDYGSDGPAAVDPLIYSFKVVNSASGLLTTEGDSIVLSVDGAGILVGRVSGGTTHNGEAAFALAIDPVTGHVSVAQYLSLQHPDHNSSDEGIYLAPNSVSVTVTATDGDGDKTSQTTDVSGLVRFEDDGPSVTFDLTHVDTRGLATALDETVGPDRYGPADLADGGNHDDGAPPILAQVTTAIGGPGGLVSLFPSTIVYGADGPGVAPVGVFSFTGIGPNDVITTNLSATHGGAIALKLVNGELHGIDANGTGDTVFTIAIVEVPAASGNFQLQTTLLEAIDHSVDSTHFDAEAVLMLAQGGSIGLSYTVTATDGDGDPVSNSATLPLISSQTSFFSFDDDGPLAHDSEPAGLGPNLIVNGSFEDPASVTGGWQVYDAITGWTTPGDIPLEVQQDGAGGIAAHSGRNLVELDSDFTGNTNVDQNPVEDTNATIQQVVATTPGTTYEFSFWYAPRPTHADSSGLIVNVNGSPVFTLPADAGNPYGWHQVTVLVTATGPTTTLSFTSTGAADEFGILLDDVSFRAGTVILDDEDVATAPVGIPGGPGDDGAGVTAHGQLDFDAGSDLLKSISIDPIGGLKAIYVDTTTNIGTQYVVDQTWVADATPGAKGGTLTGTIHVGNVDIPAYTLTVHDDGSYDFTLLRPLVHPVTDDPSTDDIETSYEDNLALGFHYTVTDGDGDTAGATLKLTVDDDSPQFTGSGIVDGQVTALHQSITESLNLNFGEDGQNVTNGLQITGWPDLPGVTETLSNGGMTLTATIDGSGQPPLVLYTLTLNTDGTYSFEQDNALAASAQLPTVLLGDGFGPTATHDYDGFTLNGLNGGLLNGSGAGIGIGDNNMDPGDALSITFDTPMDSVSLGINHLGNGALHLHWVAKDASNAIVGAGDTGSFNSDGTVSINPAADFVTIELTTVEDSGPSPKFKLTSIGGESQAAVDIDSLTFQVTGTDGDGDAVSDAFNVGLGRAPDLLLVGSAYADMQGSTPQHTLANTDTGIVQGQDGNDILVGDPGGTTPATQSQIANFVLVLDTSGSVDGSQLTLLKNSVDGLLNSLGNSHAQDIRVHIVSFGDTATDVGTYDIVKSGSLDQGALDQATQDVGALSSHGDTNYEAGLQQALQFIQGGSTTIHVDALISSPDANGGSSTDTARIIGHGLTQIALVSGWTAPGTTTSELINVNGNNNDGWGVSPGSDDNLDDGQIIRFDFGAFNDFDGGSTSSYGVSAFSGIPVTSATFELNDTSGNSSSTHFSYTVYFVGGGSQGPTGDDVGSDDTVTVVGTGSNAGKQIAYVEFTVTDSNGSGTVDLQSVKTPTDPGTLANATVNQLVFVSDGAPNRGVTDDGDESNTLNAQSAINQINGTGDGSNEISSIQTDGDGAGRDLAFTIQAFGLGSSSNTSILNQVEGTGGSAPNLTASADLANAYAGVISALGGTPGGLAPAGGDVINGNGGDDLIFGDVLNTDALNIALGVGLAAGSGWDVFEKLETGTVGGQGGWTRANTIAYIEGHQEELAAEGGRAGGNDTITAGPGNDTIYGQGGDDTINYTVGDGNDVVDGGVGSDTLVITNTGGAQTFNVGTITGGTEIAPLTGDATDIQVAYGTSTIRMDGIEDIFINLGSGGDTVNVNTPLGGTALATSTIHVTGGTGTDTLDLTGRNGDNHRVVASGGDGTDTVKLDFAYTDITGVVAITGGFAITHNGITDEFTNFESFVFKGGLTQSAGDLATAPEAPTITVTDDAPLNTGLLSSGALTNDPTLTVHVTFGAGTLAGNTVQLYDGSTPLGSPLLLTDALISTGVDITTTSLSDGGHTLTAKVTDVFSGVSSSAGFAVTEDHTPPAAGTLTLSSFTDSGSSSSDKVTTDKNFTLNSSGAEGGATPVFQVSTDNGDHWTTTTASQTNLSDGTYLYRVQVTDAAGNQSYTPTVTVTVDNTPPSAVVTGIVNDTGSVGDHITSDNRLVINGTAEAGASVQVFRNGSSIGTTTADSSGNWSYDYTGTTLSNNTTYQFSAGATDLAGNTGSTSADYAVAIDRTAPPATVSITKIDQDTGTSSTDFITKDTVLTVSGTNAALGTGDKVQVSTDGSTWVDVTQDTTTTWHYADPATHNSSFTYQVRVIDVAANVGNTDSQDVVIDTSAPSGTPSNLTVSDNVLEHTGVITNNGITNDNTLQISGNGTNNSIVAVFDGATLLGYTTVSGNSWSFTTTTLVDGAHSFTARYSDAAGNVSATATSATAVTVDTAPPTTTINTIDISADTGVDGDFITKTAAQTITAKLSANLASGEELWGSVNNGTGWTDITGKVSGTNISWDGATLGNGTSSIQFKVLDAAGNSGTVASQGFTLDTTKPTVVSWNDPDNSGSTRTETVTFSEAVSGFVASDVTVSTGTVASVVDSGDHKTYTISVTGAPSGSHSNDNITYTIAAGAVADVAGNTNNVATQSDPIILDLDHNGYSFGGSVQFDINADGHKDQVAWNSSNDGILAMDVNGDGKIDSGKEIFTPDFNGGHFTSGSEALASLDSNHDGVIDANDLDFSKLLIWQDANADGVSDTGELSTLGAHNIASISAPGTPTDDVIDGQAITATGTFTLNDGTTGSYVEVGLDTSLGSVTPLLDGGDSVDWDNVVVGTPDAVDTLHGTDGADKFTLTDVHAVDFIADYNFDQGDSVDLSALLGNNSGATANNAADYVHYDNSTGHLSVDTDGAANGANFVDVAILNTPVADVKVILDDGVDVTINHIG